MPRLTLLIGEGVRVSLADSKARSGLRKAAICGAISDREADVTQPNVACRRQQCDAHSVFVVGARRPSLHLPYSLTTSV